MHIDGRVYSIEITINHHELIESYMKRGFAAEQLRMARRKMRAAMAEAATVAP